MGRKGVEVMVRLVPSRPPANQRGTGTDDDAHDHHAGSLRVEIRRRQEETFEAGFLHRNWMNQGTISVS